MGSLYPLLRSSSRCFGCEFGKFCHTQDDGKFTSLPAPFIPPTRTKLAVQALVGEVLGDLLLPLVTVVEQFLLVVQQLLVRVGGVLKVGPLNDGIHRTCLLAEAAVDALCHVNVVAGGPPATVLPLLSLDRDRLRGANL